MGTNIKRVNAEIQKITSKGYEVIRKEGELSFDVKFKGPDGTPYSGYKFTLGIVIPANYPFGKPQAVLKTKIFHPMFNDKGEFCFLGEEEWKAASQIAPLIDSMIERMKLFESGDGTEALELYQKDQKAFAEKAASFCEMYAERA